MKKVIAIIVSALFVLSVAGLSFAADEKKAAPAPAPEKKMAPAKAKKMTVQGEVVSVDAATKMITIKGKKGDVALSVEDKAAAKLADIKVGDKAKATYKEMDGKNVASSVTVTKAAAKKAEKKAAAKKEMAPAPKAEEKK